jgi:hypothetical protein
MRADDAFGAVAALAASQHGAFSRRQAAGVDVDADQIFRWKVTRRIREPLPGVLTIVGAPATWRQKLKVLELAGTGSGVISGAAAAALHGLDGFAEGPLEVTIPRLGTLRATGARVRRRAKIPFEDWEEVDGIRCTGLARTLVDLGDQHDAKVVQRALDDVRRRGKSLRWLRMTAERLQGPGRRGPGLLLGLLDAAEREQRVPDSWFERLLELALTCPELPPIVRQHEIRTGDGSFVARVDLAIPELLLGIEGHSRQFHFGEVAEQLDEDRDLAAAAQGWEILYLGWQATLRPKTALSKIRAVAEARRRLLPVA